ncbi:MAG: hypothetical protein RPV21_08845 [Candidatus Sedimenticola sp. (ex Thyasira tokunagai)]
MKHIFSLLTLILLLMISGIPSCVNIPKIQEAMDTIDDTWRVSNNDLARTYGTRTYGISKTDAFRAMIISLTELGFAIKNQDHRTGIILAEAPIPNPLTKAEWQAIKKVEEPQMQKIAAPIVGDSTAQLFILADNHFTIVANAIFLERKNDLEISLRFNMEYTGSGNVVSYGQQPPPTAVESGIKKVWNTFEKTAFIQEKTLQ